MTDLAPHTDEQATMNRVQSRKLRHGKLKLEGNEPTTVYVAEFIVDHEHVPGFGFAAEGDFFRGIKWRCGTKFAMFVTFAFLPGVVGIDCDELSYSAVYDTTQKRQMLAMPPVPKKTKYAFFVTFGAGIRHDPQIIVTPITGDDDDE